MLTYVYHLFPNVMVATFPTNLVMAALEPLTIDRTKLITYTLAPATQSGDGGAALQEGLGFVQAGAAEDNEVCAPFNAALLAVQMRSSSSAAFHRMLHEVIDGASRRDDGDIQPLSDRTATRQ